MQLRQIARNHYKIQILVHLMQIQTITNIGISAVKEDSDHYKIHILVQLAQIQTITNTGISAVKEDSDHYKIQI